LHQLKNLQILIYNLILLKNREARIREDILWEAKPLNGRNQDELEESTAHLLQMLDIPSVHSSQILQTTTRI